MAEGTDKVHGRKQNSNDKSSIYLGSDNYYPEEADQQHHHKGHDVPKGDECYQNMSEEEQNECHGSIKAKTKKTGFFNWFKQIIAKKPPKESSAKSDKSSPIHHRKSTNQNPEQEKSSNICHGRSELFKGPMCLISTTEDGKFKIEGETLEMLKAIDNALVVVAIAGLYRTGKSYLMNCLAGCNEGFELGNTIQSKTKGIWVWCRQHPTQKDIVLLLMDTEGLGDIEKGDTRHDHEIFTLAALLCNVLVYNMMSAFNQDAVEKLTFITEISKSIKFKSKYTKKQYNGDKLSLILPTFVLCLRDFSLVLEKNGTKFSADEYLENCLELKQEKDISIQKYNRPRECIRTYFPNRKCFTFDRPGDLEIMRRLDNAGTDELSKLFLENIQCFVDFIFKCGVKQLLNSKPVDGAMFASLVESYVEAIQNGEVPDVDDAIMVVANGQNKRAAAAAVAQFAHHLKKIQIPFLKQDDFQSLFEKIQKASLAKFRHEAMFEWEQFEKEATKEMEEMWKELSDKNTERVVRILSDKLQCIYDNTVGKYIKNGKYDVPGGFVMYRQDMQILKEAYKDQTRTTYAYEASDVLRKFLEKEADVETRIMDTDQKMTKEERKREFIEMEKKAKEAQKMQELLFNKKIIEERERAAKYLEEITKNSQEHLKEEEKKMEKMMDSWKSKYESSKNQMQAMKEQNEEKLKQMNKDIATREKQNEVILKERLEREKEKYNQMEAKLHKDIEALTQAGKASTAQFEKELMQMNAKLERKTSCLLS